MVVHISTTILVWQHLLESTVVGRSISAPFSAVHNVSICTAAGTGQKSFPLSFENTVSCSFVVLRHDSSYVTTSYAGIDCVIDVSVLHMARSYWLLRRSSFLPLKSSSFKDDMYLTVLILKLIDGRMNE